MALSNAERQARFRKRQKEAAATGKPSPVTPKRMWQVFMLGVCYGALQAKAGAIRRPLQSHRPS